MIGKQSASGVAWNRLASALRCCGPKLHSRIFIYNLGKVLKLKRFAATLFENNWLNWKTVSDPPNKTMGQDSASTRCILTKSEVGQRVCFVCTIKNVRMWYGAPRPFRHSVLKGGVRKMFFSEKTKGLFWSIGSSYWMFNLEVHVSVTGNKIMAKKQPFLAIFGNIWP